MIRTLALRILQLCTLMLILTQSHAETTLDANGRAITIIDPTGYAQIVRGSPSYAALGGLPKPGQMYFLPKKADGKPYSGREVRDRGYLSVQASAGDPTINADSFAAFKRDWHADIANKLAGNNPAQQLKQLDTLVDTPTLMVSGDINHVSQQSGYDSIVELFGFVHITDRMLMLKAVAPSRDQADVDRLRQLMVDWAQQLVAADTNKS